MSVETSPDWQSHGKGRGSPIAIETIEGTLRPRPGAFDRYGLRTIFALRVGESKVTLS